jgi:hypothetical protein
MCSCVARRCRTSQVEVAGHNPAAESVAKATLRAQGTAACLPILACLMGAFASGLRQHERSLDRVCGAHTFVIDDRKGPKWRPDYARNDVPVSLSNKRAVQLSGVKDENQASFCP